MKKVMLGKLQLKEGTSVDIMPTPKIVEERTDYIDRLPDEVLQMTLLNLGDPKDMYSAYRTCKKFKGALEPTKLWLFLQVLPRLTKYITKSELLRCRMVCKSWREKVDQLVDNAVFGTPHCQTVLLPKKSARNGGGYCVSLEGSVKLERFLNDMDNGLLSRPFIGRRLIVDNHDGGNDYWENVYRVLDEFGEDIWDISISLRFDAIKRSGMSLRKRVVPPKAKQMCEEIETAKIIQFSQTVRNMLERLPNLKRLEVCNKDDFGDDLYLSLSDEVQSDIYQILVSDPFPPLPHLSSFKLRMHQSPPTVFLHLIPVQCWQQLETLQLTDRQLQIIFESAGDSLPTWFSNLKHLTVFHTNPEDDLSHLKLFQCPLESLNITSFTQGLTVTRLVQILSHFGGTLQRTRLHWVLGSKLTAPKKLLVCPYKLYTPCLKALELINPVDSLNFLLGATSLESLIIRYNAIYPLNPFVTARKDDVINIHGHTDQMYKSNIWAKFPHLKEFRFQGPKPTQKVFYYNRLGYEQTQSH